MGVSVDTGKGGGKKSLNHELNLVPFVDLLSVCVCFLLMAAVWLQIGAVQVKQSFGTEGEDKPGYDLNVTMLTATEANIEIKTKGHLVEKTSIKGADKEQFMTSLGTNLDQSIKKLKGTQNIAIGDLIVAAMITPNPLANYGVLVAVMDALRQREIVNIGVVPKAG